MLHINENDLKILLLNRKNKIESPKYNGIGEIISSISIMITLCLADFSQISIINPLYFKLGAWILSLIILIFGVFQFIKSIFCIYSINNLYSEIADLDPNIEHPFNIILIKITRIQEDIYFLKVKDGIAGFSLIIIAQQIVLIKRKKYYT